MCKGNVAQEERGMGVLTATSVRLYYPRPPGGKRRRGGAELAGTSSHTHLPPPGVRAHTAVAYLFEGKMWWRRCRRKRTRKANSLVAERL